MFQTQKSENENISKEYEGATTLFRRDTYIQRQRAKILHPKRQLKQNMKLVLKSFEETEINEAGVRVQCFMDRLGRYNHRRQSSVVLRSHRSSLTLSLSLV